MNSPKLILCDFDGVISRFHASSKQEGFYSDLLPKHPTLHKNITDLLFGPSKYLRESWMCGQINYTDVNALMAHKFGVERSYLDAELLKSLRQFTLNQNLITLLQKFRSSGTTVAIMSDNMDVFTQYAVPHFSLLTFFDAVYSSSDLKQMKKHNNWELPKKIAKKYNCEYADVLVIDDWEELTIALAGLGFQTFFYNEATRTSFETYANTLLR